MLGRRVQARDRRQRRRLRDGRDAAPLLRHAEEEDGDLDPRRRRARRTTRCRASRCSIRSSACPPTASTSTCSSASTRSTTARSSCPAGEGHTWGKVCAESVATGSVYVHADVTAVFPWLTYALLSDKKMQQETSTPDRRPAGCSSAACCVRSKSAIASWFRPSTTRCHEIVTHRSPGRKAARRVRT